MSPRARIIALGQAAAGDDGVGLAVLERLRAEGVPPDVELVRAPEDFALVHLLETRADRMMMTTTVGGSAWG